MAPFETDRHPQPTASPARPGSPRPAASPNGPARDDIWPAVATPNGAWLRIPIEAPQPPALPDEPA